MYVTYQILQMILRALIYTFIGQGILAMLLGNRRHDNFVYRFFKNITYPVWKATRAVTPGFVLDRHVGFVAVALLLLLNILMYMYFYSQGWVPTVSAPADA